MKDKGYSEGFIVLIGIIISIIMLIVFFSITGRMERISNERAAVSTLSSLRNGIDDVCSSDSPGYYKEVVVSLPENGFSSSKLLNMITGMLLAHFHILNNGDPDFIIYRGSFPQLEDLSWLFEVRESVYPFFLNYTADGKINAENYEKIYPTLFYNKTSGYELIFNVLPYNSTEGKWLKKNPYIYAYNTSSIDINVKTMRKYQICGGNSLCLKSSKYLYKYDLKCKLPIELERGNGAGSSWLKKMYEYKAYSLGNTSPQFYLVSPCQIKLKIVKGKCSFYRNVTIPIYNESGDKVGDYTIYQRAWEMKLINESAFENDLKDEHQVDCIQIIPESAPKGFCYSSPNLPAGLFYGTFSFVKNKGVMWYISTEYNDIINERNEITNYILTYGIGKIRKLFYVWPNHPIN